MGAGSRAGGQLSVLDRMAWQNTRLPVTISECGNGHNRPVKCDGRHEPRAGLPICEPAPRCLGSGTAGYVSGLVAPFPARKLWKQLLDLPLSPWPIFRSRSRLDCMERRRSLAVDGRPRPLQLPQQLPCHSPPRHQWVQWTPTKICWRTACCSTWVLRRRPPHPFRLRRL